VGLERLGEEEGEGQGLGEAWFGFRPAGLDSRPSVWLGTDRLWFVVRLGFWGPPAGVRTSLEQASRVEIVGGWIGLGEQEEFCLGWVPWELSDPRDPRGSGAQVGGLQGFPFPVWGGRLGAPPQTPSFSARTLCGGG
jgi:hypothetical protein